jgi:phosphoesterase RecJ-like protein
MSSPKPPQHSLAEIADRIRQARRVIITAHIRPDGDAVGSVMGLALSLRQFGLEVVPVLEDPVPQNLAFLPCSGDITKPAPGHGADLAIVLDTATRERVGPANLEALSEVADWINIDHHPTNPGYGTWNHIASDSPATGQLIYELLKTGGFPIDDAVRQHLYAAISTDTGSFQYPSTTGRTYQIAGEMVAAGLQVGALCRQLYETYPARRLELLRAMLNGMEFTAGGRIVSWRYHRSTAEQIGATPDDTEGLIDTMRMVDTVIAAVLFEELPDGKIRVSARSKDPAVNVANVCAQFGGGGHHAAAGARMPGPMDSAADTYLQALENEVRRLD